MMIVLKQIEDDDEHYHNDSVCHRHNKTKFKNLHLRPIYPFTVFMTTVPVWYAQTGSAGYNAVSDAFSIGDACLPGSRCIDKYA
jgi:hypothetical protein